jgi:hypothetical protein
LPCALFPSPPADDEEESTMAMKTVVLRYKAMCMKMCGTELDDREHKEELDTT